MKLPEAVERYGIARKEPKNGNRIGVDRKDNGRYSVSMRRRATGSLKLLFDDLFLGEAIVKCGEDGWEEGSA